MKLTLKKTIRDPSQMDTEEQIALIYWVSRYPSRKTLYLFRYRLHLLGDISQFMRKCSHRRRNYCIFKTITTNMVKVGATTKPLNARQFWVKHEGTHIDHQWTLLVAADLWWQPWIMLNLQWSLLNRVYLHPSTLKDEKARLAYWCCKLPFRFNGWRNQPRYTLLSPWLLGLGSLIFTWKNRLLLQVLANI